MVCTKLLEKVKEIILTLNLVIIILQVTIQLRPSDILDESKVTQLSLFSSKSSNSLI